MTDHKIVRAALIGEPVDRPPFWLMRQAGRFLPEYREVRASVGSFLDLCLSPDLATEVTLQPLRRFDMDAAILFADILIIPYALGQDVRFVEGEGPKLEPIRDLKGIEQLDLGNAAGRWQPIIETVRRLSNQLPEEKTLIGFAGAPWTVATYMVEGGSSKDYSVIKTWAYRNPQEFSALIDILIEKTIAYLLDQARAGADVLQLFDTWAGVLAPSERRRWVIEPAKQIVRAIRAEFPEIPIIGFPRGIGTAMMEYVNATEITGLSLDTSVDQKLAKREFGERVALQGNLDPHILLAGGPNLTATVREIVSALGPDRFVFNLGHGILPTTPISHVEEVVSTLKSWRYA